METSDTVDGFNIKAVYTDTFQGELNFSWQRVAEFRVLEGTRDRTVVRMAKAKLQLTGVHFDKKSDIEGEMIYKQRGACRALIITVTSP